MTDDDLDSSVFGNEQTSTNPSVEMLIAKLQEATGSPDPYLDAEIEAFIRGGVPAYRCSDSTRRSYGPSVVFMRDDGSNILYGDWWSAPSLTGSLDAALSLLPADSWFVLGAGKTRPDEPLYGAAILRAGDIDATAIGDGEHPTSLAIAVCIAALKARQTVPQTVAGDDATKPNTDTQPNKPAVP